MKKISLLVFSLFFVVASGFAQEQKDKKKVQQGHIDHNNFRQLQDVLATPNAQHTASGAPGSHYTQQKVE